MQNTAARYKAANVNLDAAGIVREAVADYSGAIFEGGKALDDFIAENKSNSGLLRGILDAVRDVASKLTGKEKQNALVAEAKISNELTETEKNTAHNGGEKFAINSNFETDFDIWYESFKKGRAPGKDFLIGRTSKVLRDIGLDECDIYIRSGKVAKILNKHPNMTAEIIKKIPEILEYPIVIMESKQNSDCITIFGDITDANGKPVLAVLNMFPNQNKSEADLDFMVVSSAYGKDEAQDIIDTSNIIWIDQDKKRTGNWSRQFQLQLPSRLINTSPISIILKNKKKVNQKNDPNSYNDELIWESKSEETPKTAMELAWEKAGYKPEEDGEQFAIARSPLSGIAEDGEIARAYNAVDEIMESVTPGVSDISKIPSDVREAMRNKDKKITVSGITDFAPYLKAGYVPVAKVTGKSDKKGQTPDSYIFVRRDAIPGGGGVLADPAQVPIFGAKQAALADEWALCDCRLA